MCSPRNKDTDSTGMIMKPVMLSCCLVIPATTTTKVDVPLRYPPSYTCRKSHKAVPSKQSSLIYYHFRCLLFFAPSSIPSLYGLDSTDPCGVLLREGRVIQNIFWTPRNSYSFPYLPIRTRSFQKSITKRIITVGGFLLLALVWYIQGREGVHKNSRYCGVQKLVLDLQTLEDETTTLSRNVGHQLRAEPHLRTEASEGKRRRDILMSVAQMKTWTYFITSLVWHLQSSQTECCSVTSSV